MQKSKENEKVKEFEKIRTQMGKDELQKVIVEFPRKEIENSVAHVCGNVIIEPCIGSHCQPRSAKPWGIIRLR